MRDSCTTEHIKIRNKLNILRQLDYRIHFLCVPGNSDTDGNTYFNSVAVEHVDAGEYPLILHVDLWSLDNRRVVAEWQSKWDSSVHGRHLSYLLPTVNTIPWFKNRKLSPMLSPIFAESDLLSFSSDNRYTRLTL